MSVRNFRVLAAIILAAGIFACPFGFENARAAQAGREPVVPSFVPLSLVLLSLAELEVTIFGEWLHRRRSH